MTEMLIGGTFVMFGVVLLIAGWSQVYQARREGRFVKDGLYGVIRHPQYLGIMLAVFGQIVHWPTLVTLILFSVIVLVYVRLAHKEEREMVRSFGTDYQDYMQQVRRFFPRWGDWTRLIDTLRM